MNRGYVMLFNLALGVMLWGIPYYLRTFIRSCHETPTLSSDAILGKWRTSMHRILEFTPDGQIRLYRNGSVIETVNYRLRGDRLEVSDFKRQPGDHSLPTPSQAYRITIQDDRLTVTPSDKGFTSIPEHEEWDGSYLRSTLPAFYRFSHTFRRASEP